MSANTKKRLKNYGLWVSVASLILLLLQSFHVHVDSSQYSDIVKAILSVLVLAGILNNPTTNDVGFKDDGNKNDLPQ